MFGLVWVLCATLGSLGGYWVASLWARSLDSVDLDTAGADVAKLLQAACRSRAVTLLVDATSKERWSAQFSEVTSEGLRLNLVRLNQPHVILPQLAALLSVQFNCKGCGYVFLGRVLRSESDGDKHHLIVHTPEDIGACEYRVAFRVNVPEALPLRASLLLEGAELPLTVHDISPAGLRVSLSESTGHLLNKGTKVTLRLEIDGLSTEVNARVVRNTFDNIGLRVPANKSPGAAEYRAIAHHIVSIVEDSMPASSRGGRASREGNA